MLSVWIVKDRWVLSVGEYDNQRDYYVLYLTMVFGLISIASTGIPLVMETGSPIKVGVGCFILLVGLAPLPYIIYKLLVIVLTPFLNESRQANKIGLISVFGYFIILFIRGTYIEQNAPGVNNDSHALGVVMILILIGYSILLIILHFAMNRVLRDKGVETIFGSILKKHKELSKTLIYKDAFYVYLIPSMAFVFTFFITMLLPSLLFGDIGYIFAYCFSIILTLEGSITTWRRNRNDIDDLKFIDSIKKNFLRIYLLPAILYIVYLIIELILAVTVMLLLGQDYPNMDTKDNISIVYSLGLLAIILGIPYMLSVKSAIILWKRKNKGKSNFVSVPTEPDHITNLQN